jgi:hypothetical protein
VPTPKAVTKKPKAATTPKPKAAPTPKPKAAPTPKAKPAVAGAFPPAPSAKEVLDTFTKAELKQYSELKAVWESKKRPWTEAETVEMRSFRDRIWKLIEIPKEQRATRLEEFIDPSASFKKHPEGMANLNKAFQELSRIVPKSFIRESIPLNAEKEARSYYDGSNGALQCNPSVRMTGYMHEFMHYFEAHTKRGLLVTMYRDEKNGYEEPVSLGAVLKDKQYDEEEVVRDGWEKRGWHVYAAKVYPKEYIHTELLAMGVERMYSDPVGFAQQDPEFFNFFLKVIQRPVDELRD